MMSETSKTKRLLIYFFYDKSGIVDRYVHYFLNEIKQHMSEILVVSNGKLTSESKAGLEKVVHQILERENKGFDVWAYKAGLEYYGWDRLASFDEVILMNFTIMGPLYSFDEMFAKMEPLNLDFWGLTLFHEVGYDPFGKIEYGYCPLHLQSHFIAVRKNMFLSDYFKLYWKNMREINSYEEAICFHEAIFTKKFDDLGYKWDVYIDTRNDEINTQCPIIMTPLEIVRDKKCPIIKRRNFFHTYADYMNNCTAEVTIKLMEYLKNNLDYDVDMIWENIIRVQNQHDFNQVLGLNYILPTQISLNQTDKRRKVAIIFHAYFDDLIEYCFRYVMSMPDDADVIFTTDTAEKKNKIMKFYQGKIDNTRLKIILVKNQGRDVSALLIASKDFISEYDYVCFAHDKKGAPMTYGTVGYSFAYKCLENILASKDFVENVIAVFENNPRLGILSPAHPIHAEYYGTVGQVDWDVNFQNTVDLAGRLGLDVDIHPSKPPVAPLGTMFWFRPTALKKLLDYEWTYNHFPQEPIITDGTILHAIERVYPLVAQDAGFYPARLYSDTYASIEIANLNYYLGDLTRQAFSSYGPNTHYNLIVQMKSRQAETVRTAESLQWHIEHVKNQQAHIHYQDNLLQKQMAHINFQERNIISLQSELTDIKNSTSWRITSILRFLSRTVRGLFNREAKNR